MDALQAAARTLHRDASAAAAAALTETIRQGCKDVQLRAVFLAQVRCPLSHTLHRIFALSGLMPLIAGAALHSLALELVGGRNCRFELSRMSDCDATQCAD